MIPSEETGYGTECGNWVFKVSYDKLSGTSIMLIVVVYFLMVVNLITLIFTKVLHRVVLCLQHYY